MNDMFTYFEMFPEKLLHVQRTEDIQRAKNANHLGIIMGLQDACALGTDLTLLPILYRLGLRIMSLTYNERNNLGDGCMEHHDQGLTHFGKQVVREMNRLGMVLDLSHSSRKTTLEAMDVAVEPPIFSHSNPYSLTPSPRCITDEQIKAIASLEGVVGISAYSPMCYTTPGQQPTLSDFLDRIDYVVKLVGIDYVGIGTDLGEGKNRILWRAITPRRYPEMVAGFDEHNIDVKGLEEHSEVCNIVHGLEERGYEREAIEKILGLNFLRVFDRLNMGNTLAQ